jgi:hypothetical protein
VEVITANSLGDGRVVFQTPTGWSQDIRQAQLMQSKEAVAAALGRANLDASLNRVVDVYAIEVTQGPAGLVPVRLRERIRAQGPTTGNSTHQHRAAPPEAA